MDTMTPEQRRACMSTVRSRNTTPERLLRSDLHRAGFRFRLHAKSLPGTPDIVFPGRHKAIFVHGCFWHSHKCNRGTRPKSNTAFWDRKLDANRKRDARNRRRLKALGWRSLTIWECEVRAGKAVRKARRFLNDGRDAAMPKRKPQPTITAKRRPGRPTELVMPDRIPDTPRNVAHAIIQGPPMKDWPYLKPGSGAKRERPES